MTKREGKVECLCVMSRAIAMELLNILFIRIIEHKHLFLSQYHKINLTSGKKRMKKV